MHRGAVVITTMLYSFKVEYHVPFLFDHYLLL